jgi:hypothetical protein
VSCDAETPCVDGCASTIQWTYDPGFPGSYDQPHESASAEPTGCPDEEHLERLYDNANSGGGELFLELSRQFGFGDDSTADDGVDPEVRLEELPF